ncbi:DotD/TraH family lipoprotein [Fangia hongkongensis]|uniref:DotD/TraH family lipoprotein n=1 Tax=Fangia hongkongensis TaxID=270495 RepID=UPI000378A3F2|nr:DotD/TraH family lipoprotein [Fangia hongkongensis]MBK2124410.1 DotD/TraH family lipoprotein [Fangia hongkongensis]
MKYIGFYLILLMFITACAHTPPTKAAQKQKKQYEYINKVILNEIQLSSEKVQQSLTALSLSNQLKYGKNPIPFKNIHDKQLNRVLSVSWYGPLENVLGKVAKEVGYKVQYFGKKPAFPILVILGKLNAPMTASAINILRDIASQSALMSDIHINTKVHIISVRYK